MPRWVFPEDRAVFVYTGPLMPILEPANLAVQIFMEPECQNLAFISSLARDLIPGATIRTGPDGLLPYFYGPPDATLLYARVIGRSEVHPLNALDASRIAILNRHQIWEGIALPANNERTPPFIWVKPDQSVVLVIDPLMLADPDVYVDYYGPDIGWVGP